MASIVRPRFNRNVTTEVSEAVNMPEIENLSPRLTIPDLRNTKGKGLVQPYVEPEKTVIRPKKVLTEKEREDINRIQTTAMEAGMKECLKQMYRKIQDEKSADDWESEGYTCVAGWKRQLEALEEAKADEYAGIMLTVNCKPGTTLARMQACMDKWLSKNAFKKDHLDILYTYEMFTAQGEHLHVHMYFPSHGRKYADWKREAISTFSKVCDSSNPRILNIKKVPANRVSQEQDYIMGKKKDSKMPYVEQDRAWKQENGLQEYYENPYQEDIPE